MLVVHSEDGKKYLSDMMDVEQDYSDNEINGIAVDTQRKEDGDKTFSASEDGVNDGDIKDSSNVTADDASHVNSNGSYGNDGNNSSQGIANGDEMGYKGREGIINSNNIPALNKRTDYYKYVREIANKTDISLDEKVVIFRIRLSYLKIKKMSFALVTRNSLTALIKRVM